MVASNSNILAFPAAAAKGTPALHILSRIC